MTKIEAIIKVLERNNGTASLQMIYDNICKYYPTAKQPEEWEAGIRGVLYRELRFGTRLKKIGLGIYALKNYVEEPKPQNDVRMHSYIEGICVELGNLKQYHTYSADPSATYRDNLKVGDFTSIKTIPEFSYKEILNEVRNIDVIWFNKKGLIFPRTILEVVDSAGTMTGAFNRSLQLKSFRTNFIIVAPEKHRKHYDKTLSMEAYCDEVENFKFFNYDEIIKMYEGALHTKALNALSF